MTSPFATRWANTALARFYAEFGWDGMISRGSLSEDVRLRGSREQEAGDSGFGAQQMVRGKVTLRTMAEPLSISTLAGLQKGDEVYWGGQAYRVIDTPLKIGTRQLEYEFSVAPIGVSAAGAV